jgi:predicted NAD/FAD-dependent oxidoreductase
VTEKGAARTVDAVVVGAGIAGLACATTLRELGRPHVVLERSRGVGGRCATRRVSGQPVDHGTAFLHGSDEGFLGAIRGVPGATILEDWPREIEGEGPPCVPKAFEPFERRLAFAEGLTVFPKHLARSVDIRLDTPVMGLSAASGGVLVHTEEGVPLWTPTVVLAVPPPTALKLVVPLAGDTREAAAVVALAGMIGAQSCLTVLAGYPLDAARPSWDIRYPDDSVSVQMISHDSTKREGPGFVVLVIQARPCWSLAHLEAPEETWDAGLIQEAARLVGAWAGSPSWVQAHRWRFARADRGSELSRPLSLRLRRGGRVIMTGESFAPGGGIEAAWLAGKASARRLVEEE